MRSISMLLAAALVGPSAAQTYRPPLTPSPDPGSTFFDNQVEHYSLVQTSPLDMVIKGPLIQPYTLIQNGPRGQLELYYTDAQGATTLIDEARTTRTVVSIALRPQSSEVWMVDPHVRAGGTDYAGAVAVWDGPNESYTNVIPVGGEPAGIAFDGSGGLAFVACSDTRELHVIDTASYSVQQVIDLDIFTPRAVRFLPQTGEVVVTSLLSGNGTGVRRMPGAEPDIASTAGAPDPLPDVDMIVIEQDPSTGKWGRNRSRDVTGLMTVIYNSSVEPGGSRVAVMGTDALNLTRGEHKFLRGQAVNNLLSFVDVAGATPTVSSVDLGVLEMSPLGPVATPTDFVFSPTEPQRGWLVARGSDKLVEFDLSATPPAAVATWEISSGQSGSPLSMVGARNAAIDPSGSEIAVYCEIEGSMALIDVSGSPAGVIQQTTMPLTYNPIPEQVQIGMGIASDARLSLSGSTSCLACHVDGNTDAMAWELSKFADPELSSLNDFEQDKKGPMVTQTLRGMPEVAPYHWRGEQADLASFAGTVVDLMEGQPLTAGENEALVAYMNALRHPANPRQKLDRSYAGTSSRNQTGDAALGLQLYSTKLYDSNQTLTCVTCHQLPTGTSNTLQLLDLLEAPSKTVQVAQLRGVEDKLDALYSVGGDFGNLTRTGAGLNHNSSKASLAEFVGFSGAFPLLSLSDEQHIEAFLQSFDTGMAPATGYLMTLDPASATFAADYAAQVTFFSSQAKNGHADFQAWLAVTLGSVLTQVPLYYDWSQDAWLTPDLNLGTFSHAQVQQYAVQGNRPLTIYGSPRGQGPRRSIDTDGDGILDGNEASQGTSPFLADSDGDGRPDGMELDNGEDPTLIDTSADATTPVVTSARVLFVTTNTAKLEVLTNEPTLLTSVDFTHIFGTSNLRYVASNPGEYAQHHVVILQELPHQTNLIQLQLNLGIADFLPRLTFADGAGLTTSVALDVNTGQRIDPVVVREISAPVVVGASQPNVVTVDVTLTSGTVRNYPFVLNEAGWDVQATAYYGRRNGAGELDGLQSVLDSAGLAIADATTSTSAGVVTLEIQLPASFSTDVNPVLGISITDVLKPMSSTSGKAYREPQSYGAIFQEFDLVP